MRRLTTLTVLILIAAFVGVPTAAAAPAGGDYEIVDLGGLGGDNFTADINNRGQVVGSSETSDGPMHAVLWEKGTVSVIDGPHCWAYGINERGQTVGVNYVITDLGVEAHGVLWYKGERQDLGTLGAFDNNPTAINNRGQIVGSDVLEDGSRHAYLWEKGEFTDLGTLGGTSVANAINNRGQVVGTSYTAGGEWHAFLWDNGVMTDLGTLGGGYSSAHGINARGQVVGTSYTGSGSEGFLWEDGVMTGLGGSMYGAWGINNRGQIVGAGRTADGHHHAVVWDDGVVTDLGTLPGDRYSEAVSINERGDIVGTSTAWNGPRQSVLWER